MVSWAFIHVADAGWFNAEVIGGPIVGIALSGRVCPLGEPGDRAHDAGADVPQQQLVTIDEDWDYGSPTNAKTARGWSNSP